MLTAKPRFPVLEIALLGFLPSPLKRLAYRLLRGYRIGPGVSIGFGSVICGEDVEIGEGTSISFLTVLRGNRIRIGAHVQIGAFTILDTPHLEIGEGTKINEQVFVGGLQFPDSKLIVGRNCQIMQMTFINPARSITIGDDSGIGGDCLLFGHTSWLSRFEGYPVEFESIEIGRSVSLAWRVFVLPGTQIGDGAVIGANSLVRGSIPPRCLAVGFPARPVSRAPEFPRPISDDERRQILRDIVGDLVPFLQGSGFECSSTPTHYEVQELHPHSRIPRGPRWRFAVDDTPTPAGPSENPAPGWHAFISLNRIPTEIRSRCERQGILWIDIAAKERASLSNPIGEELIQFLRRYGVRFLRQPPSNTARP